MIAGVVRRRSATDPAGVAVKPARFREYPNGMPQHSPAPRSPKAGPPSAQRRRFVRSAALPAWPGAESVDDCELGGIESAVHGLLALRSSYRATTLSPREPRPTQEDGAELSLSEVGDEKLPSSGHGGKDSRLGGVPGPDNLVNLDEATLSNTPKRIDVEVQPEPLADVLAKLRPFAATGAVKQSAKLSH